VFHNRLGARLPQQGSGLAFPQQASGFGFDNRLGLGFRVSAPGLASTTGSGLGAKDGIAKAIIALRFSSRFRTMLASLTMAFCNRLP